MADQSDDPYWRILFDKDGKLVIACLQWFDEGDYDQTRFLDEKRYETEALAQSEIDRVVGQSARILAGAGGKALNSLDDFNSERRRSYHQERQAHVEAPNGIACPECGHELVDCDRSRILESIPPQLNVLCQKCRWSGHRVA